MKESSQKNMLRKILAVGTALSLIPGTMIVPAVQQEDQEVTKEETVYIFTDASGNQEKVMVNEWLKNNDGSDWIEDATMLENIENLKGEETYQEEGKDQLKWDSQGNDIYYRGTTDQETPIELKITYKLDGKEVTPQELAGKSGRVTIRYEYINKAKRTAQVAGKTEDIYVPFTVMSGMIFEDGCAKNVEVSTGRVITEGDRTIVVGLAFPGLAESMNLDVDIPDYLEVTMDAEAFSMPMAMSVVLDDVLDSLDFLSEDKEDGLDEMKDKLDTLSSSSQELADGSQELADGILELYNKLPELTDGTGSLSEGIVAYTDGVSAAASGASQLKSGTGSLSSGANALLQGAQKINKGASTANKGMADLEAGSGEASESVKQLVAGGAKLSQGANQLKEGTAALNENMPALKAGAAALVSGIEQLSAGLGQMKAMMVQDTPQAPVAALKGEMDQLSGILFGAEGDTVSVDVAYKNVIEDVACLKQLYESDLPAAPAGGQTDAGDSSNTGNQTSTEEQTLPAEPLQARGIAAEAENSAAAASDSITEAESNIAAAQSSVSNAEGAYNTAVGVYSPILSDIANTLGNTPVLSQYASRPQEALNTASYISDSYKAAAGQYEAAAQNYQAAISAYQESIASYEETIASYEQTIAEYEALLSQKTVAKQLEASEPTVSQGNEGQQTQQPEAFDSQKKQKAWANLETDLERLGTAKETGKAILKVINSSLFGDGTEQNPGMLQQMAGAVDMLYAAVGSGDGADSKTLLGGARVLSVSISGTGEEFPGVAGAASQLAAGASELSGGMTVLSNGLNALSGGADQLYLGANRLMGGLDQLSAGTSDLYSGTKTLVSGAAKLDAGASSLQSGMSQLTANTPSLVEGAQKLDEGAGDLSDGVEKLKDGSEELKDGMQKFNEEGVQKLIELLGDDMDQLVDRIKALKDAGSDYSSFAGITDGMEGSVKFIIKTEGI